MTPLGAKVHVGVVAFALNVTHTDPNEVERRRVEGEEELRGEERREKRREKEREQERRAEQSKAVQKRGRKLIKLDFKFRRK